MVAVLHQRIEQDARGHHVLRGELMNESGENVNIPHVLATYYDTSGKVIWVSDGYVDQGVFAQGPQGGRIALLRLHAPDEAGRALGKGVDPSEVGDEVAPRLLAEAFLDGNTNRLSFSVKCGSEDDTSHASFELPFFFL